MKKIDLLATRPAHSRETRHADQPIVVDRASSQVRHDEKRTWQPSTCEANCWPAWHVARGTPVSRTEILSQVLEADPNDTVRRTLDMQINLLRKKLGLSAPTPVALLTVYGVGSMLTKQLLVSV